MKMGARVTNILPQFDPATRTLKLRLEAENPRFRLRPEMFVDVELPNHFPPSIAIPAAAILDTGLTKTVFIDGGNGHFEPRHIQTGSRLGDRVEVTRGLREHETIVVSGNFLIDSESRLREPQGVRRTALLDPVSGMGVDLLTVGERKSLYQGEMHYFCSNECKAKFDQNPDNFAAIRRAGK